MGAGRLHQGCEEVLAGQADNGFRSIQAGVLIQLIHHAAKVLLRHRQHLYVGLIRSGIAADTGGGDTNAVFAQKVHNFGIGAARQEHLFHSFPQGGVESVYFAVLSVSRFPAAHCLHLDHIVLDAASQQPDTLACQLCFKRRVIRVGQGC